MEQKEKTIAEILKNAPKGTKLYSPVCGESIDWHVRANGEIVFDRGGLTYTFDKYGRMDECGECLLFPSKDNRSWEDFEYRQQFKPFDKMVVRDSPDETWKVDFFCYYNDKTLRTVCTGGMTWKYCLPYNEMTARLIGTTDELNGC